MTILNEFNLYFLILMIIQGLIVSILDSKNFKRANMLGSSKVAKVLGIGFILLSLILYVARLIYI